MIGDQPGSRWFHHPFDRASKLVHMVVKGKSPVEETPPRRPAVEGELVSPIQFGKYMLFKHIGRGGMADVYKARIRGTAGFERTFVVKRILSHLCSDPSFTKMLIDEAKIAARLNHPNIVQVFELGNVGDEYFMSMEYVRGHDLAEIANALWERIGAPRPELVAYIGREICRALAYAHDFTSEDGLVRGMIHRDVSPSNVMISHDGSIKLLDFGIAKALGSEQEATQAGKLKGKFAYMAPEQTLAHPIDHRIDIFAVGVVLHELLTGRRLFKGRTDLDTIELVRGCKAPPPSQMNPLCPRQLDRIVLQALARNRDLRWQSAARMADALDDIVHAARFQPGHLARIMANLFPGDVNSLVRTGSLGPVPAVETPTSRSNVTDKSKGLVDMLRRVLHGRTWAAMSALLVLVFVVLGSMIWTLRSPARGSANVQNSIPKIKFLDLAFQSSPLGADVYLVGNNEYLGRTPFRGKVEVRDDRATFVVFRLAGYLETTSEIQEGWSGSVILQAAPPPSKPNLPVDKPVISSPARSSEAKPAPIHEHNKLTRPKKKVRVHDTRPDGRKISPFR
jgi:serine/threonine protein kinase